MQKNTVPALTAFIACGGCLKPDCDYGCTGCDICETVCEKNAITIEFGFAARVKEQLCDGCGKCVDECPQKLISLRIKGNRFYVRCASADSAADTKAKCAVGCVGCGLCARLCPASAISIENGRAKIDDTLCLNCGLCAARCPRHAIGDSAGILAHN